MSDDMMERLNELAMTGLETIFKLLVLPVVLPLALLGRVMEAVKRP